MFQPGDVISYLEMCQAGGVSFQKGMYFHLKGNLSVLLMSVRKDAPYGDQVQENGRVLIYEGHDVPRMKGGPEPKAVDQPGMSLRGALTQNQLFFDAAMRSKRNEGEAELVEVYEKLHRGIWVYNGLFRLADAWQEQVGSRKVFRFRLELVADSTKIEFDQSQQLDHQRVIPSNVKLEVWKRDKGRCVQCGAEDNLHFDHIIPFSKGGSSLVAENIQLLCARHNLLKHDKIE